MTDEQGKRLLAETAMKAPFTFEDAARCAGVRLVDFEGDVIEVTDAERKVLVEKVVGVHAAISLMWATQLFKIVQSV